MRSVRIDVFVHLVWSTWDRSPSITTAYEARLWGAIRMAIEGIGGQVVAIGGVADHVHVLVRVPATIALSELVKRAKGVSSHVMNHEIAVGGSFRWQGGYGAFSVSPKDVPFVTEYICSQKRHHEEKGIDPAFEPGEHEAVD
jgi:REP element-mobilizing transposase RayT